MFCFLCFLWINLYLIFFTKMLISLFWQIGWSSLSYLYLSGLITFNSMNWSSILLLVLSCSPNWWYKELNILLIFCREIDETTIACWEHIKSKYLYWWGLQDYIHCVGVYSPTGTCTKLKKQILYDVSIRWWSKSHHWLYDPHDFSLVLKTEAPASYRWTCHWCTGRKL